MSCKSDWEMNVHTFKQQSAFTFCNPLSSTWLQMMVASQCTLLLHTFHDAPNQVIWKASLSVAFTVSSQYRLLQPPQPPKKGAKNLWTASAPLKVRITTWLVFCDPIGIYLHRCHIRPLSSCVFCGLHLVPFQRIFLSFTFAMEVWDSIVIGLNPSLWLLSLHHMWEDRWTLCIPGTNWKIWDIRVKAIVWSIWNERNSKIFNQKGYQQKKSLIGLHSSQIVRGNTLFSSDLFPFPFSLVIVGRVWF